VASRRNTDADTAQALIALVLVGGLAGWWKSAGGFVQERLPLFVALAAALAILLVLVVRRRLGQRRSRRARQRQLDSHVRSTDGMSGQDFERLVARLLQRDGFNNVRIPAGAGDLGADVLAMYPDGRTVVVQCKRYSENRSASSPDMQKFLGTCFHEHNADEAWFVTTTRFSRAARDLGLRRGVRLVDRQQLAEWMASPARQGSSAI
jgi:restriction system protein